MRIDSVMAPWSTSGHWYVRENVLENVESIFSRFLIFEKYCSHFASLSLKINTPYKENRAEWLIKKQPEALDSGNQGVSFTSGLLIIRTKSFIHYLN